MMKKVLITGTSGFIGKNLLQDLEKEYHVLSPGHQELDLLDAGMVQDYLQKEQPDFVIHSAVQGTLGLPESCKDVVLKHNLQMFFHLQRANEYYGKMFYFGSGAEYAKDAYVPKMKETYYDTAVPSDDYGLSKYIMAKSVRESGNIYDLRLFGVFGAYENYNYRFISNCICKSLMNRNIVIHRNIYFDYLYVKDLCKIIRWFLAHEPKEHYYNVCTGNTTDIYTLAEKIVAATGSSSRITIESVGLGNEYSGDNTQLLDEMGGYAFTDIDTAIEELIHFYRNTPFQLSGDY